MQACGFPAGAAAACWQNRSSADRRVPDRTEAHSRHEEATQRAADYQIERERSFHHVTWKAEGTSIVPQEAGFSLTSHQSKVDPCPEAGWYLGSKLPPGVFEPRACGLPRRHPLSCRNTREDGPTCSFNCYDHALMPVVFCDLVRKRPATGHGTTVVGVKRSNAVTGNPPKQVNVKQVSVHVSTRTTASHSTY